MPSPRFLTQVSRSAARSRPAGDAPPRPGNWVSAVVSNQGGDNSGIFYVIVNGAEVPAGTTIDSASVAVGQYVWVVKGDRGWLIVGVQ